MTPPAWTADSHTTTTFAELSGDHNPIHKETAAAQAAGFDDVVVHGMCVLGVTQQAARAQAPGRPLRRLDVRFAAPVLPGQTLTLDSTQGDRPDGSLRVQMQPSLVDPKTGEPSVVIKPAFFTFGDKSPWPLPWEISDDEGDVVGEPFVLDALSVQRYTTLVTPAGLDLDDEVPPMACLLGMTDALAKAFGNRKPPKPGSWVHLRQQGDFHRPIQTDLPYRCRIQEGRAIVRQAAVGFQVVLRFVVEEAADRVPAATGTVTLMYLFDKE